MSKSEGAVDEWRLSDAEWERLGPLLMPPRPARRGRGRPPIEDDRAVAQACLFRHHHSLGERYHCFGWNRIPADLGISPAMANRRFRRWSDDGSWARFWDALMALRRGHRPGPRRRRAPSRPVGATPVLGILGELERAFAFFNDHFFAGSLPRDIAITIETSHPRGRRLGYFCGQAWRDATRRINHICVFTSALGHGAEPALETLLHEMVHHRNYALGLVDCTDRGRYHNAHFRDAARLAGLECLECDRHIGFGRTALGERARQAISRLRPSAAPFEWVVDRDDVRGGGESESRPGCTTP
jgi:transposase